MIIDKLKSSTGSVHRHPTCLEFILQCVFCTGLASLSLDVQVDEEETWEKCAEEDSQVSTELNLKRKRSGRERFDDRVHGKGRSGNKCNRNRGSGSFGECLGDCNQTAKEQV